LLAVDISSNFKNDAEFLCAVIHQAGALGLKLLRANVRHWNKADGSVVTEADLAINEFLHSKLQVERPDYGWLSEETPDDEKRLLCKRIWIVDPIDGTRSFVHKTDGWCVGVALVENGRPIISALYRPMIDELYFAVSGCGAWLNNKPMVPRDGPQLAGAELLGTGRAAKLLQPEVIGLDVPHIPLLLRLAYVASGQTDIAFSIGHKNDWDLAAGDLFMQESGAMLTTIDGATMMYNKIETWQNGMVAAGRLRHKTLMKKLETL
jgi:myo-inositol-1(or 4)-monophosphatase